MTPGWPDQTQRILEAYLDGDFRVYPLAADGMALTAAHVRAIGKVFGVTYPDDYVAHVCGHFPGVYVEVIEAVWPRPKPYDAGPFWSFLYALQSYTPVSDSEPWMRLDIAAGTFQKQTGLHAAPILRIVGDPDVYCTTEGGALVRFRHETNTLEALEGASLDFWQLFEYEVSELYARKVRKKAART